MAEPLPSQAAIYPRFPIEVWEHVIETVYDARYFEVPAALATLSSCALVCRAWCPRAQQVLFYYVVLRDKDALYRFAELVDASPSLGTYVRTLAFRGYLHVPYSPAVLFLTVLRERLTNLLELSFHGFDHSEKAANPLPEGEKELPCLPFHRYFPSLLTAISHIRSLDLVGVHFTSFGDFARLLSALRNLQELYCHSVSWAVLGVKPACFAKRSSSFDSRQTFLPNLNVLQCTEMDAEGMQSLLSALGPSLHELNIKFPNRPPTSRVEHPGVEQENESLALDLRSFPHLDRLYCLLAPFPQLDVQTLETLQDTLVSWMPKGDHVSPSQQCLYLQPWDRTEFMREQFIELLRTIGPIVEGALCRREPAQVDLGLQASADTEDDPETDPCKAIRLVVFGLGDRLEWEEWWRTAITECFPMLSRWNSLNIYSTHMSSWTQKWRDYDETPQEYARRRHRKQYALEKIFGSSRGQPLPEKPTPPV